MSYNYLLSNAQNVFILEIPIIDTLLTNSDVPLTYLGCAIWAEKLDKQTETLPITIHQPHRLTHGGQSGDRSGQKRVKIRHKNYKR